MPRTHPAYHATSQRDHDLPFLSFSSLTGSATAIGANLVTGVSTTGAMTTAGTCAAARTVTVTVQPESSGGVRAGAGSSSSFVSLSGGTSSVITASATETLTSVIFTSQAASDLSSASVPISPPAISSASSSSSNNDIPVVNPTDSSSVDVATVPTQSVESASSTASSTVSSISPTITASPTASPSASTNTTESTSYISGSLADLMNKSNGKRYFGTEIQVSDIAIPQLESILGAQFDSVTPGNEMKWQSIQPTQGVFDWTGADAIVAEAKKIGAQVRGHNFCWNSQTPDWVTSITNATELDNVLETHINAVMGRYADDLEYFDVINEPLDSTGAYQSSVWYDVLGADFVAKALTYAHAAAPNVKLCINDYSIEDVNTKSASLLAIATALLNDSVPLHCIGFESHFIGGEFPGDIAASMKQFTDIGLEVAITELDIRIPVSSAAGSGSATDLATQATDYSHAIGACLGNDLCPGVTVWGFADATSWIPAFFSGEGDADLYDETYTPKAAYTAVVSALTADSTAS